MKCAWVFAVSLAALSGCRKSEPAREPPPAAPARPAAAEAPATPPAVPDRSMALLPTTHVLLPDSSVIFVEVAGTPEAREVGLMFRSEIPAETGMLFVFPDERPREFWMKNTWADLDMVWISKDKKIHSISAGVPKSERGTPDSAVARRSGTCMFVLELAAGAAARHKLAEGQALRFDWRPAAR